MKQLYLIGNAHLDPAWLWPWQEGFSEVLATYRSALDRLKEFPDITFTSACAVYYQWVEAIDPAMFAEIRQYVEEGRWEIAGGWLLQPDCNTPDGESYLRHGLLSQRYFKEKFGITATTGYNVDSFGHNASLPKILQACGLKNYVFMRPSHQEQGQNEDLFWWESDDHSRVCAYRIPLVYNFDLPQLPWIENIKKQSKADHLPRMVFYGIGNHGGGPTIELINKIHQLPDEESRCFSSTDTYFQQARSLALPTVKGELQHHARGCYSAHAVTKQMNRKCEHNLWAAEVFSVMAKHLTGASYPARELEKGWHNLLFNQFHDILGGCSIRQVYDDAAYGYGETMHLTEEAINTALQRMSWQIDTLQGETLPSYKKLIQGEKAVWTVWQHEKLGTPIIVFNPHPFPVEQCVQVYSAATAITDDTGTPVSKQTVRGAHTNGDDKYNTAFLAKVPAMGYKVYRLHNRQQLLSVSAAPLTVTQTLLENSKLRVTLDSETGDIGSIYDKVSCVYLLNAPCKAVVLDESQCDTWAHNRETLGEQIGQFTPVSFSVTEEGPVRASIRVTSRWQNSSIQRTYTLTADADQVLVQATVDFHETHKALKFSFPITDTAITAKIPFGTVRRGILPGEEPCGSFIACGRLGIANDGKYAYDVANGDIRLTILRGAVFADHYGQRDDYCEFMEQGIHKFSYSLFPYTSNSEAQKRASVLNFGLRRIVGSFHNGSLPQTKSCLKLNNPAVLLSAVKQREDGTGDVVRLYDMDGKDAAVSFELFGKQYNTKLPAHGIQTLSDDGQKLTATEWDAKM